MKTTIRRAAIVLMIMTLMTATAFAGTIQVKTTPVDPQTMQVQLENQTDKSSIAEEKILLIGMNGNDRILMEIEKAVIKAKATTNEAQLEAIRTNLEKKAAQISEVTIEKIERLGGEAVCELVAVTIGGKTIMVDPIRIVRLR